MGKHSHGNYGTVFPEVNDMDQVKISKFIATLRKEAELTQESLGEKIGVTNKTVSRWENCNYMPDINGGVGFYRHPTFFYTVLVAHYLFRIFSAMKNSLSSETSSMVFRL